MGLSTSGDAVNLFDAGGNRVTGVSFGAATATAHVRQHGRPRQHDAPASGRLDLERRRGQRRVPLVQRRGNRLAGRRVNASPLSTWICPLTSASADSTCPNRRGPLPPANSLLAQEASAVTYDWDTDTLFVVGDGGTSIVQVTKTGQLIDSMTLAPGGSPQGTEFYDTGRAHLRRRRQVRHVRGARSPGVLFTYVAGTTLTRSRRADRQARHVRRQHRDRRHLLRPADRRIHRRQGDAARRDLPDRHRFRGRHRDQRFADDR